MLPDVRPDPPPWEAGPGFRLTPWAGPGCAEGRKADVASPAATLSLQNPHWRVENRPSGDEPRTWGVQGRARGAAAHLTSPGARSAVWTGPMGGVGPAAQDVPRSAEWVAGV